MAKVKIIADSTCDLSIFTRNQCEVDIVPLYVTLGNDSYMDGVSVGPRELYAYFDKTNQTPKTSAASVEDFLRAFSPYAREGRDIVCVTISSRASATYEHALLAAKEFPNITIRCVDSLALSAGTGTCVIQAAEWARQGLSAGEIGDRLAAYARRVRTDFIVDTMTFLYHGGRCSAIQAYGATLLRIKPQISVADGVMHPTRKFRGGIVRVAKEFTESILDNIQQKDPERIILISTQDSDPAIFQTSYDIIKATGHFKDIMHVTAGCVITSHCGKNVLGIISVDKE